MSWLRLDDSFVDNGKIGELSDGELRVWLRVLCHCARAQDPTVDAITIRSVSGLTRRVLMKLLNLELLDEIGTSGYEVHHWAQYQSRDVTGAERQARWRARRNDKRNDERNDSRNDKSNGETSLRDRYKDRYEHRYLPRARPDPTHKNSSKEETVAVDDAQAEPVDNQFAPPPSNGAAGNGTATGFNEMEDLVDAERARVRGEA